MPIPPDQLPKFKAGEGIFHKAVIMEPGDGGWWSWAIAKDGVIIAHQDSEQHVPSPWYFELGTNTLEGWAKGGLRIEAIEPLSKEEAAMILFTIKENRYATPLKVKEKPEGVSIFNWVWF